MSYNWSLYAPHVSVHGPRVELAVALNRFRTDKQKKKTASNIAQETGRSVKGE